MATERPKKYFHNPCTPFHTVELDGVVAYITCLGVRGPKHKQPVKFILDSEDAERFAREGYVGIALWIACRNKANDQTTGNYYLHVRVPLKAGSGPAARRIMNCPPRKVVDHISGITEDNRKANLRITTTERNVINRTRIDRRNKSGVHGVKTWVTKGGKRWYSAHISINKVQVSFPATTSLAEAAATRRKAELEHYGEYAPKKQLVRDDIDLSGSK